MTSSPVVRVSAPFLPTQLPSPRTEGERTALPQKQRPLPCSHPDCCLPGALEGPGSGHAGLRSWPPGSLLSSRSAEGACDPPPTFRLEARLPTPETTNQSKIRWAFHLRGLSQMRNSQEAAIWAAGMMPMELQPALRGERGGPRWSSGFLVLVCVSS